jgi:excisionase family DNA binding protein
MLRRKGEAMTAIEGAAMSVKGGRQETESGQDSAEVMTVAELAALLRVNRKTLYEALARREIPGVRRIGRTFRISRSTVVAWLHGQDRGLR